MEYTLSLTDVADDEVCKAVVAPLVEYNSSQAGPRQTRPIANPLRMPGDECSQSRA